MEMVRTVEELQRSFGIAGIAEVSAGRGGLPKISITGANASGEMYLHGAQVTSWKPTGSGEVLFLSDKSQWQEGAAIRGGIPICFPWFGPKAGDSKALKHGFARNRTWQLQSIVVEDDSVTVTMSTASDEETSKLWPHAFQMLHRATFGSELRLELEVTNTGQTPLRFEEALHAYYRVEDVRETRVAGLDGIEYLDNTDSDQRKSQLGEIVMTSQTDRAFLNTDGPLTIIDMKGRRQILVTKQNSLTTVVWNPWEDGASALKDLGAEEWNKMVCVEVSNIRDCAVDLGAGEHHVMRAVVQTKGSIANRP